MTEIRFTVPGPPLAWKRTGGGKTGRRFKPPQMRAYQMLVAGAALRALSGAEACLCCPRTHSWPVAGVAHGIEVRAYCRRKGAPPDIDNVCAKIVLDALEGLLWTNDRTVEELHAYRYRVPPGEERLEVRAWVITLPTEEA